jgi:group I intron endonuclease
MQIYEIKNKINGKLYIGKDEKDRKDYYGSGLIIKLALKKYGSENFEKTILEYCDSKEILCEKEKYWIKIKKSITPIGYNICEGGNGGDTTSNHPNKKEIIEKRRKSNIGKKRSLEFCKLMSEVNLRMDPNLRKEAHKKGRQTLKNRIKKEGYTEKELDAHEKNAERLRKFNKSIEGRKKVSQALKGIPKKPFSKKHRDNIGKASKGRKIPGKIITIDGIESESLHDASRKLAIPLMTIRNRLINEKFIKWIYGKE